MLTADALKLLLGYRSFQSTKASFSVQGDRNVERHPEGPFLT